jgi:hypothetical protein
MELKLEIPDYNIESGISYNWERNFVIETSYRNGQIHIKANKEGLISLANHFLNIAQESVPTGHHMHFDDINSLEDGSIELIIEKI